MYQVGQAVISPKGALIISNGNGWEQIDGSDYLMIGVKPKRPATEAEILAEIAKRGWVKDSWGCYVSPLGYLELIPEQPWAFNQKKSPATWDALALCGKEQIQVSIIGNALNLTK
jgi:hypothetical protein